MSLPPGQHAVRGFPRFGTHLHRPPPPAPPDPAIEITGSGIAPFKIGLDELGGLPRREQSSDFHCVAGWSATGIQWEGIPFETLYSEVIRPALDSRQRVTWLEFGGLDGYRVLTAVEDALSSDVLLAERLDGRALDPDHGAPIRLVSPSQYGYVSVKHLSCIKVHGPESTGIDLAQAMRLLAPHTRARVWEEERHRYLHGRGLRLPYRLLSVPIRFLCDRR